MVAQKGPAEWPVTTHLPDEPSSNVQTGTRSSVLSTGQRRSRYHCADDDIGIAARQVKSDGIPIPRGGSVEREAWADVAKGACIVLVVLWHVITKHYLLVDWRLPVPIPGVWGTLGELFLPLRMPLFFTVSGVFAAPAVARPWRAVALSRVAGPYYLYGLWLMVHTLVLTATPGFPTLYAETVPQLLAQLTVTPTDLWSGTTRPAPGSPRPRSPRPATPPSPQPSTRSSSASWCAGYAANPRPAKTSSCPPTVTTPSSPTPRCPPWTPT
jgi:hypothetical protein